MFYHVKKLQFDAEPTRPDPLMAKKVQELIGGPYGEMTVAMQYLFQGWNCRASKKYQDMIMDIGTEELAHVEMVSTMVSKLLDGAPLGPDEANSVMPGVSPAQAAAMNPKHAIASGGGALPADSVGYPWNGNYIIASGNLLADFRANVAAESQGRLQAVRIYEMAEDEGLKKMLEFMIARDTMHQNQWLAAIEELQKDGLEEVIAPSNFDRSRENQTASYQYWDLSEGNESQQGAWAQGTAPDGKGQFEYIEHPEPQGQKAEPLPVGDKRLHNTGQTNMAQSVPTDD